MLEKQWDIFEQNERKFRKISRNINKIVRIVNGEVSFPTELPIYSSNPMNLANFFFHVNNCTNKSGVKLSNSDIDEVNYIFVDVDFKNTASSVEDTLKVWQNNVFNKLTIKPSIIVKTGGGLHIYFEVAEQDRKNVKELALIQKAFVKMLVPFGADGGVCDLARVLRVPQTLNSKYFDNSIQKMTVEQDYEITRIAQVNYLNPIDLEPYSIELAEFPYTIEDFKKIEFNDFESELTCNKVSVIREKVKINENERLKHHDYFYQLVEVLGGRHPNLLKYAAYLKQNYHTKEEVLEIIDKLSITVESIGNKRSISFKEIEKIVEWVFSNKTIHNYVWSDKQLQKLIEVQNKLVEISNNDKYFLKCLETIFSHIKKYGPSFFMSFNYFEEEFSKGTCQKLIKLLIDNNVIELVESGGFVETFLNNGERKVRKMANHYRLVGFSISKWILYKIKKVMSDFREDFNDYFRKLNGKFSYVICSGMFGKYLNIGNYGQIPQRC